MHLVFFTTNLEEEIAKQLTNKSFVGNVGPYTFYEHPEYGDESPLIAHNTLTNEWGISHWWELPKLDEIYGD